MYYQFQNLDNSFKNVNLHQWSIMQFVHNFKNFIQCFPFYTEPIINPDTQLPSKVLSLHGGHVGEGFEKLVPLQVLQVLGFLGNGTLCHVHRDAIVGSSGRKPAHTRCHVSRHVLLWTKLLLHEMDNTFNNTEESSDYHTMFYNHTTNVSFGRTIVLRNSSFPPD